jgi:hypothetical protein
MFDKLQFVGCVNEGIRGSEGERSDKLKFVEH